MHWLPVAPTATWNLPWGSLGTSRKRKVWLLSAMLHTERLELVVNGGEADPVGPDYKCVNLAHTSRFCANRVILQPILQLERPRSCHCSTSTCTARKEQKAGREKQKVTDMFVSASVTVLRLCFGDCDSDHDIGLLSKTVSVTADIGC